MAKQLVKQNIETHDTKATEQITASNSSNVVAFASANERPSDSERMK